MKQFIRSLVVLCVAVTANAGVTTRLTLDCRTGVRVCSADGETLLFDASWHENGEEVRVTDNGVVLTNGTAGVYTWLPEPCSSTQHVFRLEILSAGQVVGTETAEFSCAEPTLEHATVITQPAMEPTSSTPGMTAEIRCSRCGEIVQAATVILPALGYIRNVTARQLWPHNKVALEFTVASDIGEVKGVNEDLSVWCARGWDTNVATRILGDRSAKPGTHRIIWDLEADGLRFVNAEATFGVSVEGVPESPEEVQLWENGPYWSACNVGASRPEEYGYYFWWGDTVGYKRNANNDGWVSVKDGTSYSFNGCPTYGMNNSQLQSAGYIDSTGNLTAAHDAATAHLGAPWRMPTDAEFAALISNCDTTWTQRNGVWGRLVTGRGGYASKSIFLPAAGSGYDSDLDSAGSLGYYWSSTPYSGYSSSAWNLGFDSSDFLRYRSYRDDGRPVRPLRGFAK